MLSLPHKSLSISYTSHLPPSLPSLSRSPSLFYPTSLSALPTPSLFLPLLPFLSPSLSCPSFPRLSPYFALPPLYLCLSVCIPILAIFLPLSVSLSRPSSSPPSLYLLPLLPLREQAVFALWKRPLLPPPPTLSTLLSISSCSHLSVSLFLSSRM